MFETSARQIQQPGWLDLERIVNEKEAARIRGVSVDTLRRQALRSEGPLRRRLSPRRVGYRLGDLIEH
jgi:hypothetical protein